MDPWEFRPPVLVGERVVWLGSGSGIPQGGVVKWIGKMPEMGPDWTVGMELDTPLPYGGIDGTWGSRHLFTCKPKHGLIVPIKTTLRESDLFQRPRQSGSGSQHGRPAERLAPSDLQPKPAERARKPQLDVQKKANAAAQVSAPPRRKLEPQRSQDLIEKQKLQDQKRLQELQKLKDIQELEQQRRLQDLQRVKELQELQKLRELQEEKRIEQQILLELEKRSQKVVLPEIFADPLLTPNVENAAEIDDSEDDTRKENGEPSAPAYEETLPKTVPTVKAVGPQEMPPREDFEPPQSPLSLVESSDQWSSATGSPVPQSPDSRRGGGRGSKASSVASEASSYSASSFRSGDNSEVERLTAQLTMPKGLADFKANLQTAPVEGNNMNTLAVNRVLRRLEAAIAGGQHAQAAGLARDLARQKISCSVTRQRRSLDSSPTAITVDMYVEDKVSHQGPIPLQVTPTMTVAQLKQKVEQELEIPVNVQRWILGKLLASDDSKTLADHNVNATGCPMFLYLVAPDGDLEADNASASGSTLETPPAEEEEEEGPMQFPAPPGKGWYYNYEEDHYSLCEDSEDDLSEEEVRVLSNRAPIKEAPTSPKVATEDETDDEEFEEVDEGDDGEDEEEEEEEEMIVRDVAANVVAVKVPVVVVKENLAVPPEIPRLPEAYSAVAGGSRGGLAPMRPEETTGTLKLGWQCPVCTLVNAPTRPGCAACTTERPENYVVPTAYRANKEEGLRLEREQQLEEASAEEKRQEEAAQHQHYLQLVNLDKTDLVPNMEAFDCSVCLASYGPNDGTVLRECLHTFCRPCLVNTVLFNQEAEVKCPYRDANYACDSVLQEREIKALVPKQVYEQHLAKSVAQAENKIGNAFHCKTPDCRGWCIFEDNLNEFHCPVCVKTNCLTCQAIHIGINCKQYQEKMKQESETNIEAKRTKDMLEDMVYRGEAMKCPTCQVILMKKWGCDWLRCSMCKTEICWVTRGPRWGPGGKGDTTAGCQCGLNGFKCHPRCNYCH